MIPDELRAGIEAYVKDGSIEEQFDRQQVIRELLHTLSPNAGMPIDYVRWIPMDQVVSNQYNPNSVARIEMGLLYTSIKHDGYTQPIVAIYDDEKDQYVIVDGFHRFYTMKSNADIQEACNGMLPVVVIDKDINDRMASTVRHNRARGSHSIEGMSGMVFEMLKNGWKEADICSELGMQPEELIRLKHITGFSALFKDAEFSKEWKAKAQLRIEKQYREEQERLAEGRQAQEVET